MGEKGEQGARGNRGPRGEPVGDRDVGKADLPAAGSFLLLKNKKKNVFRDLESVSTSLFNLFN